jgi:hypothetical protein
MAKKSFPRPRKRNIDLDKVKDFLKEIDFQPDKVFQEWRHVLAFGTYQGKKTVFKLASTQKTSWHTKNEYHWNEAVNAVPAKHRQHLRVPANYAKGTWQKLFWFIADQFPDKPLVKKYETDTSLVAKKLLQIAQTTREINTLPLPEGYEFSKPRNTEKTIGEKLLNSTTYWAENAPEDLEEFVKIVAKRKQDLRTCSNHGDFVPRQLYDLGDQIGVIDGEHAGAFGPLYYDVAQFYIRLRDHHQAPDLAKQYLELYRDLLPEKEQEVFWEELKPPLCQRYVGTLWGDSKHTRQKEKRMKKLYQLGEEILNDQVI